MIILPIVYMNCVYQTVDFERHWPEGIQRGQAFLVLITSMFANRIRSGLRETPSQQTFLLNSMLMHLIIGCSLYRPEQWSTTFSQSRSLYESQCKQNAILCGRGRLSVPRMHCVISVKLSNSLQGLTKVHWRRSTGQSSISNSPCICLLS